MTATEIDWLRREHDLSSWAEAQHARTDADTIAARCSAVTAPRSVIRAAPTSTKTSRADSAGAGAARGAKRTTTGNSRGLRPTLSRAFLRSGDRHQIGVRVFTPCRPAISYASAALRELLDPLRPPLGPMSFHPPSATSRRQSRTASMPVRLRGCGVGPLRCVADGGSRSRECGNRNVRFAQRAGRPLAAGIPPASCSRTPVIAVRLASAAAFVLALGGCSASSSSSKSDTTETDPLLPPSTCEAGTMPTSPDSAL